MVFLSAILVFCADVPLTEKSIAKKTINFERSITAINKEEKTSLNGPI